MDGEKPSVDDIGAMMLGEEEVSEAVEEPVEEPILPEDTQDLGEDTQEEGEEEASEEAEESFVEIEVDGELLQVPERFKDHFLRQQDYTQKTQQLANDRKAVEVALESVEAHKAQYEFAQKVQPAINEIATLSAQIEQAQAYLRDNVTNLSAQDITQIQIGMDDLKSQIEKKQVSIQEQSAEFQQAQEQSFQELLKKGTEVLQQRIPGWGEETAKQVRDYAIANGFSEQEANSVVDPRQVEILYKASQYDQLKKGAAPAVKALGDTPAIKPKSRNPMPEDKKRELNLRKKLQSKNLSAKDKQRLIAEDIGARWA